MIDYGPETEPPPFTTIAWRVCHIAATTAGYLDMIAGWDWDVGVPWDRYEIPTTAAGGISFFNREMDRLQEFITSLTAADLDRTVVIPFRPEPVAIVEIIRILVVEAIHHGAEAGALRDISS